MNHDREVWKEQVRSANNILEVIGDSVALKRVGREHVGLCPIHDERTPSFYVNEEKQVWNCHGCKAGGDLFDFVMQSQGVDFKQAMELLGARAGINRQRIYTAPIRRPPPIKTDPVRPPKAEVDRLWESSRPVSESPEAIAWCSLRGLDWTILADRDELARVIPDTGLPEWAAMGNQSWHESGHRMIVPMYDASGCLLSLHGRYTGAQPTDKKALFARGFSPADLVMADGWGRLMLTGELRPRLVWICEGVPDFLTVSLYYGDACEDVAVLGVVSGSWTAEIAARVPDGARVVIATDNDTAGEGYRNEIMATFSGRQVRLEGWKGAAA